MAYVQPNSIVQLFKGINLDNRYMHTIYFANESAQNAWFTSKVTYTFQQISYTRYTKNSIKLKADTTDIIDCTYLRFKNDRNVDKWFYAFINSVEYVNENTCLITYEIDVMQTWFIQNGSVRPCMVLREHVNDDTFGKNLEPEPIGSEMYDKNFLADANTLVDEGGNTVTNVFKNFNAFVTTGGDPVEADLGHVTTGVQSTTVNGLFNYTLFLSAEINNSTEVQALIADMYTLLGSWDKGEQKIDVFDITQFPTAFSPKGNVASPKTFTKSFSIPTALGDYTPKNKKLLGYPYNLLLVTSKDGSCGQYKWEYFNTNLMQNPTFKLQGSPLGGGNIICYPRNYNGVADAIDEKVVMNDFPKSAFSYDAYQAWVASGGKTRLQNAEQINNARMFVNASRQGGEALRDIASATAHGGSAVISYKTGDDVRTISEGIQALDKVKTSGEHTTSLLTDIVEARNKIVYQWKDAEYRPNMVVGTPSPVTAVAYQYLNFYFYQVHVRENEAKHLDDFLSCYGYAINRVKTPNLTGRQYWNFVQTQDCVIAGNMPSSSKEAIARIFDGGIFFWRNGDQVGNFSISVTADSINNPIV